MRFPLESISLDSINDDCKVIGYTTDSINYVSNIHNVQKNTLSFYTGSDMSILNVITAGVVFVDEINFNQQTYNGTATLLLCSNPLERFVEIIRRVEKTHTDNTNRYLSNTQIHNNTEIDVSVKIGKSTCIGPFVSIYSNTLIGNNCHIQSSSAIGVTGLAYTLSNGEYIHFPHLGAVKIADNVDIGANTTIVKGILQDTLIGNGTKIGNNVNIGHNVTIKANCFISSNTVIAGSAIVDDNCWIAAGVSILNKVHIAKNCLIAIGSVVSKSTKENGVYAGNPARRIKENV